MHEFYKRPKTPKQVEREKIKVEMMRLGPDTTLDQFRLVLANLRIIRSDIVYYNMRQELWPDRFKKERNEMHPGTQIKLPHPDVMRDTIEMQPEVKPPMSATPSRPLVGTADKLGDFVRFVTVVEAVGGIERAKQYLGLLEHMKEIG